MNRLLLGVAAAALMVPAAGGAALSPYLGQVATRSMQPNTTLAQTNIMSRVAMYAVEDLNSFQLKFGAWHSGGTSGAEATTGIGSAVTYKASIEYPAGTFTQITWAGSSSGVAAVGADTGLCDAITTAIPQGAKFFVRVYATTTASGIPVSDKAPWLAGGDASVISGSSTDQTMSGTVTGANLQAIFPLCVVQTTTRPTFLFVGDSRTSGTVGQDAYGNNGQFGNGIGTSYAYINVAQSGASLISMQGITTQRRSALSQYVSHVMNGFGINDVFVSSRSLATIQSLFQTVAYQMPGKRHIIATLSPDTTSTDGWATTANQTTLAAESVRVAFNAWAKTLPDPYFACIDIASATESVSAPGKWNPGHTSDGLHQNAAGSAAIVSSGVVNYATLAADPGLPRFSPFQFPGVEWYNAADYYHNSGVLGAVDNGPSNWVGSYTFGATSFGDGGPGEAFTGAGQYWYRQPSQTVGRNTGGLMHAILWTPSANPAANTAIGGFMGAGTNLTHRAVIMVDTSGRPGIAIRRLDSDATVFAWSSTAMTVGSPYLLVGQYDPANGVAKLYVNGQLAATANYASSGNTEDTAGFGNYISFYNGKAAYGTLGEWVAFNATVTDTIRQKLEGDIAWRRGAPTTYLPSGHPYYSARPGP